MKFSLKNKVASSNAKLIAEVEAYFSKKKLFSFFKKKKFDYDYDVVNPEKIFGELKRSIKCFLVGDAWESSPDSEVIAFIGFNDWKWGFVSKYFEGSRAVFFKRKAHAFEIRDTLVNFPCAIKKVVVWGYNEPKFFSFLTGRMGLTIIRMEDGFLRSFDLGASHSTPYSLVVDGAGLYFNPRGESQIERFLNTYEFSGSNISDAKECLSLLHELRLSKYNAQGVTQTVGLNYKFSRRIAIIGQVDGDQSIRLGNIQGWSMMQLIKLARFENPDAEIIYRPHPDVYNGYQKSAIEKRRVEKYCTISAPTSNQIEFLNSVDHVYTITSLSGLEALMLGKKVTVVGTPFYAGWGLTDDRVTVARRERTLTLEQLFYSTYLQYPRYLANVSDAKSGFISTCYKIAAEREIALHKKVDVSDFSSFDERQQALYWPKFIFGNKKHNISIRAFDFSHYFSVGKSLIFKKSLFLALLGKASNDDERDWFLLKYRLVLSLNDFNGVLIGLARFFPGEYLRKHFSWVLGESGEIEFIDALSKSTLTKERPSDGDETVPISASFALTDVEQKSIYGSFLVLLDNKKYQDALKISEKLLLNGFSSYSFLIKLGYLSEMLFDSESALNFARFCKQINLFGENRKALLMEFKNLPLQEDLIDSVDLLKSVFLSVDLNPERISNCAVLLKKYGLAGKYNDILKSSIFLQNESTITKSQAYLEVGSYPLALRVARQVIISGDTSEKANIAYAKALFAVGNSDESLRILKSTRNIRCSDLVCRELIRQLVHVGDFSQALSVIEDARNRGIAISETISIPVYLGLGKIGLAYSIYLKSSFRNDLISYFKDKYLTSPGRRCDDLLVMAVYGPGDEIRFASLYSDFDKTQAGSFMEITCDYRLQTLLSRSFPSLNFVPVRRNREFTKNYPAGLYDKLPGADLCVILDNNAMSNVERASDIVCVTDLISQYRKDYSCFPGAPYLIPDEGVVSEYKDKFPKGELLVGISWRSSLQNFSRNEHYLSIEDVMPIFEINGIRFVNLQYDECSEELAAVERRFPGKLINYSEIDQFNDLDTVAGLMMGLDLIISPATTVVELAGALGCNTWLLSNSAELQWRKIDDLGTDVWHNSVKHLEADNLGDKSGLVKKLAHNLKLFAKNSLVD